MSNDYDQSKVTAVLLTDGKWHSIVEGSLSYDFDGLFRFTETAVDGQTIPRGVIKGPAQTILAVRERE